MLSDVRLLALAHAVLNPQFPAQILSEEPDDPSRHILLQFQ